MLTTGGTRATAGRCHRRITAIFQLAGPEQPYDRRSAVQPGNLPLKPVCLCPGTLRNLTTGIIAACLVASCTVTGPSAIRSGRLAYNEAIAETNNQQMLRLVAQNRYEENGSLLAVSSITANVRMTTNAGIQLGFADSDDYAGNLVPFSAGAVYEENPTITYTPVDGAEYARQVFSPVPVSLLVQMTEALVDPAHVYAALISSVNGVRNPDFHYSPNDADPRFQRFVAIMTTLTRAHRLHWVEDAQQPGRFSIVIDHYEPPETAEVRELLDLLGLPVPAGRAAQVTLTVFLTPDGRASGGVGILTRSVGDLVEMLSAAIEVPEEDVRRGVARSYPPLGPAGNGLQIHYSKTRQAHAAVAVQYRDGWFYIDETDQVTKRLFRLMTALWSITIAESATKGPAAPVLTVPVSR